MTSEHGSGGGPEGGPVGSRGLLVACRWPLLYCLVVKLLIYVALGNRYGYMGDELYFMQAGRRLDLGYLDFPPMVAWAAALTRETLGESLHAIRFLPFVCGALVSMAGVAIAYVLGAGRLALWVTAIVVTTAPVFTSFHGILTMNAFDQLWWALALLCFVTYLGRADPRCLLALGVIYGLGGLTKLSIGPLAVAMAVVLVVYRPAVLRERLLYVGLLAGILVTSPFLYWQIANDFPFLAFSKAYKAIAHESFVMDSFVVAQVLTMNPPNIVIWLPGIFWLLLGQGGRWRPVGVLALTVFVLCYLLGVRFYFFATIHLLLVAGGAMLWERLLVPGRHRVAAAGLVLFVLVNSVTGLPTGAPVLSPAWLDQALAGFERDVLGEDLGEGALGRHMPHFAEMHGWRELARTTASHYRELAADHGALEIVTAHFGQASAINLFAAGAGLPEACSGHMHYVLWCRDRDIPAALVLGFSPEELSALFAEVEVLGGFDCELCTRRERELQFVLVRDPVVSRGQLWSALERLYIF